MYQRGSQWTDFRKIWYWGILTKVRWRNPNLVKIWQRCRTLSSNT